MKPLLVAVVGPTATGKTDAAIALCKALGGEAISMDSMQIYYGMRIGTARPKPDALGGILHHMLATVPPDEPFSVAAYAQHALPLINTMLKKGTLPVMVGGTGLYLDAVQFPFSFADADADPVLRGKLEKQTDEALHKTLTGLDLETANRLSVCDRRRVIRALEIVLTTGRPMSQARDQQEARFDLLPLGLTMPRDLLYERINARVEAMFEEGLVDEVDFLLSHGLSPGAQSMQAIGYKETARMLQGECTRDEAIQAIAQGTRRYAKRQWTWFRKTAGIRWFDTTAYKNRDVLHEAMIHAVQERMTARLEGRSGG